MATFHVPEGISQNIFEGDAPADFAQYDQYINNIFDLTNPESPKCYTPGSPFNPPGFTQFIPGTYYQYNANQAFDIIT